jgi:hypothetical protein
LQLTGRPRLASLSILGFLVLGLCELLGRLSLGLALGELLARRMPLSRLTLLELLELLALGEVVEYLSFDELLAGLSFGLGLDGLLGRLALGEVVRYLAINALLTGLDLGFREDRELFELPWMKCLELRDEGVDGRLRAHFGERIVVVRSMHDVDGFGLELVASRGLEEEKSVTSALENADASTQNLRDGFDLEQTGMRALGPHADTVQWQCFVGLIQHMLGESGSRE